MTDRQGSVPIRRIAIGIVVERRPEGVRILISRRPEGAPLAGYWEFPGGKCEVGESPEACVRREYREELGVAVEPVESLEPIEHAYAHDSVRLHPFVCRRISGEPRPLAVAAWRWVRPEELTAYAFPPANAPLLEALAQRLKSGAGAGPGAVAESTTDGATGRARSTATTPSPSTPRP